MFFEKSSSRKNDYEAQCEIGIDILTQMISVVVDSDFQEVDFSGLPEMVKTFLQVATGAADIPVTRLLGQSPAGLSATGESDTRNYYDMIAARPELELRPSLERLDRIVAASEGIDPGALTFAFRPLWQLSYCVEPISPSTANGLRPYCEMDCLKVDGLPTASAPPRLDRDPLSSWFGGADASDISSATRSASRPPALRVVRIPGAHRPDPSLIPAPWSDSVLQALSDAMHAVTVLGATSLMHEARSPLLLPS